MAVTLASIMARTKAGPGGCRIWQGARSGEGYPQIRTGGAGGGRIAGVHRLVVELSTGRRIPRGRVAAHRCATPLCVEPTHIRATTYTQNLIEGQRWP